MMQAGVKVGVSGRWHAGVRSDVARDAMPPVLCVAPRTIGIAGRTGCTTVLCRAVVGAGWSRVWAVLIDTGDAVLPAAFCLKLD